MRHPIGGPVTASNGGELPLSSAIEANGLVFVSGQLALINGQITGDIATQTTVVIDRIAGILDQARLSLDDVVKATIWLTDATDFGAFNAIYAKRFSAPYPARSTVISRLAVPGARIEIEVVASRPDIGAKSAT